MNKESLQYCDHCGAKLIPGSRFCDACGQALDDKGSVSQPETGKSLRHQAKVTSGSFMRQRIAWALIFGLMLIPAVGYLIWKDVGEFSVDVWLSLGAFIFFTAILAVITLRKAGGTWQGVLFDAIKREKGIQFNFLTDQGKMKIIFGGASLADYFKPGERVIKIKGFDFPEKLERDGERQLCVVCGKVYSIKEKRCRFCRFPSIDPQNYV